MYNDISVLTEPEKARTHSKKFYLRETAYKVDCTIGIKTLGEYTYTKPYVVLAVEASLYWDYLTVDFDWCIFQKKVCSPIIVPIIANLVFHNYIDTYRIDKVWVNAIHGLLSWSRVAEKRKRWTRSFLRRGKTARI